MVRIKSVLKGFGIFSVLFIIDMIIQSVYLLNNTKNSSFVDSIIIGIMMVAVEIVLVLPLYHGLSAKYDLFKVVKLKGEDFINTIIYVCTILLGNALLILIHTSLIGKVTEAQNQESIESLASPNMLVGLIVLVVFVAPIVEEMMFRGVILTYLVNGMNKWIQIVVSGSLFGLFHILGNDWQWFAFIQYSFMGCVLAYACVKGQKLQYSIMAHMGNNLIAVMPLILLSFK